MQTAISTTVNLHYVIKFLRAYRSLEKASYNAAFRIITYAFDASMARHLCDKWKYNEKDFGGFFLNLDHKGQERILNYWAISYDNRILHKILLLFNNRSCSNHTFERTLNLTGFTEPPEKHQFGNAANWGDYILSLPAEKQQLLLDAIVNNYEG